MFNFIINFFKKTLEPKTNKKSDTTVLNKKDIFNIKEVTQKSNIFNKIESFPKNKNVILIVDSYDCGWIFDSGIYIDKEPCYNQKKWKLTHVDKAIYHHMPYSHWFIPDADNLTWKDISLAPKDKVVILGNKIENSTEMDFCVAWWFEDEQKWVTNNTIPINTDFKYFSIISLP